MYCVFLRAYSVYYGSIEMVVLLCTYIYYHIYIYSYINGKLLHERKSSICKADSVEDELHIKLFMLYNQLYQRFMIYLRTISTTRFILFSFPLCLFFQHVIFQTSKNHLEISRKAYVLWT